MHRAPTEGEFGQPVKGSLATIIGTFKAAVTRRFNTQNDSSGGRFWQRNYYERIIRDEGELHAIRAYIRDNPASWAEDLENRPGLYT
jgi:putative transposase